MSWDGNYWGPGGALTNAKKAFEKVSKKCSADHIAYASALYSAGNRLWADAIIAFRRRAVLNAIRCLVRGTLLKRRAVVHVGLGCSHTSAGGEQYLTYNQVETCIAIYRGSPLLTWNRLRKMRTLFLSQFGSVEEVVWNSYCSPHTKAFFLSHAVACGITSMSKGFFNDMTKLAELAEVSGEFAQASRVWKHIARHWQKHLGRDSPRTRFAFDEARRLANLSSPDQVVKLEAST